VGLDFTDAIMRGVELVGGSVRNCVFDDADLDQFHAFGTRIRSCWFRNADLRDVEFATYPARHRNRCRIEDVTFDGAQLGDARAAGVLFARCSFRDCRFGGLIYGGCSFDGVVLTGSFQDSVIGADPALRHTFRAPAASPLLARLDLRHALSFQPRGYSVTEILLPRDGSQRRVHHAAAVLQKVLDDLPADDERRRGMEMQLVAYGEPGAGMLVDRRVSSRYVTQEGLHRDDRLIAAAQLALDHPVYLRELGPDGELWREIVGERETRRLVVGHDGESRQATPDASVVDRDAVVVATSESRLVDEAEFAERWTSSQRTSRR
jgi:hypothetical protein